MSAKKFLTSLLFCTNISFIQKFAEQESEKDE